MREEQRKIGVRKGVEGRVRIHGSGRGRVGQDSWFRQGSGWVRIRGSGRGQGGSGFRVQARVRLGQDRWDRDPHL